ncbi:unnamed protein product [Fusarium fujikuroi]|nr:unnamed protein product [Fusarium fujikuroi]
MQCSRSNIARATSHGVDSKGVAKAEAWHKNINNPKIRITMASAQRTMIRQTLVGSYFNKERLQRCLERTFQDRDGQFGLEVCATLFDSLLCRLTRTQDERWKMVVLGA